MVVVISTTVELYAITSFQDLVMININRVDVDCILVCDYDPLPQSDLWKTLNAFSFALPLSSSHTVFLVSL